MKNNVKRVIAFVIVVLMMIIITACNQKPGTPALSDGESKGSTSEAGQSNDYSEHYTFTIASVQVNEATDYNGDEFSKWWLNNFNFEWDVIAMNFDNWEERVRIWISSGDMPDITIFNYKHGKL